MITKIPFDKKLQSETKEHLQSPSVISIHTGNEKAKIRGIKITCKKNNIKRTRRAKLVTWTLNSFYKRKIQYILISIRPMKIYCQYKIATQPNLLNVNTIFNILYIF